MIQNRAISLVEPVISLLRSLPEDKALKLQGLIESISVFDLITNVEVKDKVDYFQPHLAVIHNIITRGLPTFPSRLIEEKISESFGIIKEARDEILGEFKYSLDNGADTTDLISDAFHLIDPRLKLEPEEYNTQLLESTFESDFVLKYLTEGNQYLRQLLLPQRLLSSIVKPERASNHINQRVDLSLEIPYLQEKVLIDRFQSQKKVKKNSGYIIELDGPQHTNAILEDNNRDVNAKDALWETLRIKSGTESSDIGNALRALNNNQYLQKCREIGNRKITGKWNKILQTVLSPVGIARIQKVLIDFIISNIKFQKEKQCLNLAIIERDIPCGLLAVLDLTELALNLKELSADRFYFPDVKVKVFSSEEFINSPLHDFSGQERPGRIDDFNWNGHNYDLVIDIAILRRSQIEKICWTNNYIQIRSSHFSDRDNSRIVYTSDSIRYKELVKPLPNEGYELISENVRKLEYFLKNIFRKLAFLDGQLLILDRALQNKSVIGLLPTGGGKSLTYQLASVLQPGIVLIVDPIKSLMQDQYENLLDSGIDSAVFINSTLSTFERKTNTTKFESGEMKFCFVSPERLIIEEFRNALLSMHNHKIYFSYCVIDEVHCVSEWGHDFRTAYLSLGKNAIEYCKTKNGSPIPIFGLTATASFDVLADVERELSYKNNLGIDAIVRRENSIRDEIQYRIIQTEAEFSRADDFKFDEIELGDVGPLVIQEHDPYRNAIREKAVTQWKIKELLGDAKRETINTILGDIPEDLKDRFSEESMKSVFEQTFDKFLEDKDYKELALKYDISDSSELKNAFVKDQLKRVRISNIDGRKFFNKDCKNGIIIFCPHRQGHFGVTDKYKWKVYRENVVNDQGQIQHRKGDYVLDRDGSKVPIPPSERKSISDNLSFADLLISTFIGSGGDNEKEEKKVQDESFNNQTAFIENRSNVMVATKAFGMGINKRNIRSTIHLNIPSSLEGFVQEGGRAGRDRKLAINYILINNQNFSIWDNTNRKKLIIENKKQQIYSQEEFLVVLDTLDCLTDKYFFREDFERLVRVIFENRGINHVNKVLDCIPIINNDREILMYFHNRSFKGQDKEKAILHELRDRITYPNVPRTKLLEEKIKDELLIEELSISVWNGARLYFNAGFKNSFGYLDLDNLRSMPSSALGYDPRISSEILEYATKFIIENYNGLDSKDERSKWLQDKQLLQPEFGIERWVLDERIPTGSKKIFKVHFENLYYDESEYRKRLTQFWSKVLQEQNIQMNLSQLNQLIPDEENIDIYIDNIESTFNLKVNDILSENQLFSLKIRFYCRRKKDDTDKAIYRLQSIGLIDDYTVDYNNKVYYLTVIKKEPSAYVNALFEFLKRYYSEIKTRKEIEKIDQTDKACIIRNCINFLTDFIYNEIEKKRRVAIDDMIAACEEGADDNNLEFKEFVYTYFNSKFARQFFEVDGINYSLLAEENTDNGKRQSIETVWKFIEAVTGKIDGSDVDNLKHLRGACLRILRSNPDNATLNLLKAYALFILGSKNENLLTEASNSYFKGFTEFRDFYPELNISQFRNLIEKFRNYVHQHTENEKVKGYISKLTNLLFLQLTSKKFNQFKTQFIIDYGR